MVRKDAMPLLQIGKSGITPTIVAQAKQMIKVHKIIKVKFIASNAKDGKDAVAQELAQKTGAKLTKRVGFTAILSKKR